MIQNFFLFQMKILVISIIFSAKVRLEYQIVFSWLFKKHHFQSQQFRYRNTFKKYGLLTDTTYTFQVFLWRILGLHIEHKCIHQQP